MQCVMHSQYHRGQNATRLRELGGSPPITDYILWLYKSKPPATVGVNGPWDMGYGQWQ